MQPRLEAVFEQLGWQTRYNLRSMRGEWSTDSRCKTWKPVRPTAWRRRSGEIIAETFSYRTVKEGKKALSAR